MLAGFRKLDNLVVIVDNNNLQIDGRIDEVNSPYQIEKKIEAFKINVININKHDFDKIAKVFLSWNSRLDGMEKLRMMKNTRSLWKI